MLIRSHVAPWLAGSIVLGGVILASPLFLSGQSSGPADAPAASATAVGEHDAWWKGITTDGFLSFSYVYNINDPVSRLNQFRVFDFNDDDPQLDAAQLVIQHPVSERRQFGIRALSKHAEAERAETKLHAMFSPTYTTFFYRNQGTSAESHRLVTNSFSVTAKWYFARDAAVPFWEQFWFRGPGSFDQTKSAKMQ